MKSLRWVRRFCRGVLCAGMLADPAFAEDAKLTVLIKQGDAEEERGHPRPALAYFRAAERLEPANAGVLLRISKQYSDLIAVTTPREAAEKLARRALEYALRAEKCDPLGPKAHLSVAIAYGKLTDFIGGKTKVEYSKFIRAETMESLRLDPADDFAWHVLGRWHAGVTNISPVLKTMAKIIYGGLPPASNEDAARCLKKAVELAPQRIIHHSTLARIYQVLGETELATKEWQTVAALPALDHQDELEKTEARKALDHLTPIPKNADTASRASALPSE